MRIAVAHYGEVGAPGPTAGRYGRLVHHLASRGHAVVWVQPSFSHLQRSHVDHPGAVTAAVRVVQVPTPGYRRSIGLRRLLFLRAFSRRAARAVSGLQPPPDVVLAGLPPPSLARRLARSLRRPGVPYVLDVRDLWPEAQLERLPAGVRLLAAPLGSLVRRRSRAPLCRAAAVVVTAPSYGRWVRAVSGRDDARWIPMGAPAADGRARARDSAGQPLRVTFVGSHSRHFDLATVVDGAGRLAPGVASFSFVGLSGDEDPVLRRARATLSNVTFAGWQDRPGVRRALDEADVALAPYATAGAVALTNKVFEYAGAGLPILYCGAGDLHDVLSRYGAGVRYAPSGADLADAVMRLAADRSLRARLAEGSARLADDLSERRAFGDFEEVLAAAAPRSAPGQRG